MPTVGKSELIEMETDYKICFFSKQFNLKKMELAFEALYIKYNSPENVYFIVLFRDEFILTEDGYGIIKGRYKDIIIRGGENISPKEIEDVLTTHPSVIDAQVSCEGYLVSHFDRSTFVSKISKNSKKISFLK